MTTCTMMIYQTALNTELRTVLWKYFLCIYFVKNHVSDDHLKMRRRLVSKTASIDISKCFRQIWIFTICCVELFPLLTFTNRKLSGLPTGGIFWKAGEPSRPQTGVNTTQGLIWLFESPESIRIRLLLVVLRLLVVMFGAAVDHGPWLTWLAS